MNTRLYVDRAQLPEPDAEEFYVADLIGMAAIDAAGKVLGAVATVHDYGAGVSLEIVRDGAPPLLVPFTRAATPEVDLANRRVTIVPPEEADWRNTDEANDANDVNDANETNDAPSPLEEAGAAKRTEGGEGCIGRDRVEGGVVPKAWLRHPSRQPPPTRGGGVLTLPPARPAPPPPARRAPPPPAPPPPAPPAPPPTALPGAPGHDLARVRPDPVPRHVPGAAGDVARRPGSGARPLVPAAGQHPRLRHRPAPDSGRHPLRRRPRHGDASGRDRRRPYRRRRRSPARLPHPPRPPLHPGRRLALRRHPRPHPALRTLRRRRPARHRRPLDGRTFHRRLRPVRRRAPRPGRAGRRRASASRRDGRRRQRHRGKLRPASAGIPTLHPPRRLAGPPGTGRTCCRVTTPPSPPGAAPKPSMSPPNAAPISGPPTAPPIPPPIPSPIPPPIPLPIPPPTAPTIPPRRLPARPRHPKQCPTKELDR